MLTARREQILNSAVAEYITLAQPVSSRYLQGRHDFGVSPATIRSELLGLSEEGYLAQPHASSGRVPTDKGYRFFVDRLLERELGETVLGRPRLRLQRMEPASLLYRTARELSLASSLLALVAWRNLLWKEGWESMFSHPEFRDSQTLLSFAKFMDDAEKHLERLAEGSSVKVSIGAENRFSKVKDFSIMVTVVQAPHMQRFTVALLGPRRMAYEKHLRLLSSLSDSFHG